MSIIDKLFGESGKQRTTPAKADAPMQNVLDHLARLGGKPIETLTAQEARKSQDGGIRFGRKTGRCISIGPFFLHCGRVQALKYAHLLEP